MRAFFAWLDAKDVASLAAMRTHHVSAYVELNGLTTAVKVAHIPL